MRKLLFLLIIGVLFSNIGFSQKYFSKTGEISFYSHTPMEDIEAESHSANTVYDAATGAIQWAVLIKSFEFEKALMQEHFNENYMESTKYPKAQFKGVIANYEDIKLTADGTYTAEVSGDLTIHGVTQPVKTKATFKVLNGSISAESSLNVLVADYGISIPAVVKDNIAKEIAITIKSNYELLEKS